MLVCHCSNKPQSNFLKKVKNWANILTLEKIETVVEFEDDSCAHNYLSLWNCPENSYNENGRIGNLRKDKKKTKTKHSNDVIARNDQNTEKSPEVVRKLDVLQIVTDIAHVKTQ